MLLLLGRQAGQLAWRRSQWLACPAQRGSSLSDLFSLGSQQRQYQHSVTGKAEMNEHDTDTPPFFNFYNLTIKATSSKKLPQLTASDLLSFAKAEDPVKESALKLNEQLPPYVARVLELFHQLPFIVGCNPYLKQVHTMYATAFKDLHQFSTSASLKNRPDFVEKYTAFLQTLLEPSIEVLVLVARGLSECVNARYYAVGDANVFMKELIQSRIHIRFLMENHMALLDPLPNHVGVINTYLSPTEVARNCVIEATEIIQSQYGKAPFVVFDGKTDFRITFVEHHLYFILLELLKNAMAAVVDKYDGDALPPLRLTFAYEDNQFVIRLSDQGKGFNPQEMQNIMRYSFERGVDSVIAVAPPVPPELQATGVDGATSKGHHEKKGKSVRGGGSGQGKKARDSGRVELNSSLMNEMGGKRQSNRAWNVHHRLDTGNAQGLDSASSKRRQRGVRHETGHARSQGPYFSDHYHHNTAGDWAAGKELQSPLLNTSDMDHGKGGNTRDVGKNLPLQYSAHFSGRKARTYGQGSGRSGTSVAAGDTRQSSNDRGSPGSDDGDDDGRHEQREDEMLLHTVGIGLPLSYAYARYFNGDLALVPMPGMGVDAFVTMYCLKAYGQPLK